MYPRPTLQKVTLAVERVRRGLDRRDLARLLEVIRTTPAIRNSRVGITPAQGLHVQRCAYAALAYSPTHVF
jgi:hypothetical protein